MLISQKHAEMRRKRCRKTPDPLRLFRFVCPCACSVIVLCCWVFSCRGWRPPLAPPPTHRPHRLLFVALVPRKARKDRERERERGRRPLSSLSPPSPSPSFLPSLCTVICLGALTSVICPRCLANHSETSRHSKSSPSQS